MKKIGVVVAGLAVIIAVLHFMSPPEFKVERQIIINKPKAEVFAFLKSLKNEQKWSPWAKKDPNMSMTYRGVDGTVGSVSAWAGNKEVGEGEQEVKNIIEGDRIDLELRFKKPMENTGTAYFITETIEPSQTRVRWGMIGQSHFPANIICLIINMKKMLADTFDDGLNQLKKVMESQAR